MTQHRWSYPLSEINTRQTWKRTPTISSLRSEEEEKQGGTASSKHIRSSAEWMKGMRWCRKWEQVCRWAGEVRWRWTAGTHMAAGSDGIARIWHRWKKETNNESRMRMALPVPGSGTWFSHPWLCMFNHRCTHYFDKLQALCSIAEDK